MNSKPRAFQLVRDVDVSGVSGIGVVAEGVAFSDDSVALRWLGDWPTSVVFHDRGLSSVEVVHGHSGATRIVYLADEMPSLLSEALQMLDELREHEKRHYGRWTHGMMNRLDAILLAQ